MAKPPWFPLYVKDVLSDAVCTAMPDDHFGIYVRMMCAYWNEGCSLPSDLALLARILRMPLPKLERAWSSLQIVWQIDGAQLRNRRLDAEWAKQAARSKAAAAKALRRWQPDAAADATAHAAADADGDAAAMLLRAIAPPSQSQSQSHRAEPSGSAGPSAAAGQRLRLPDPTEERAREILRVLWPIVEPAVGRTITRTEWGKRNKATARDLAIVGRSDDDLLRAHEHASKRLGSTVYSLHIVRDELARLDNPTTPREKPVGSVTEILRRREERDRARGEL